MATEEETKAKIKGWLNEVLDERQAARDAKDKADAEKAAQEAKDKKPAGILGGLFG